MCLMALPPLCLREEVCELVPARHELAEVLPALLVERDHLAETLGFII
jgi:hypothetical protein